MNTTVTDRSAYSEVTANMPSDPEVLPQGEASESVSTADFPITTALCASTDTSLDWVPAREEKIVPEPMAQLCRQCSDRAACLRWAIVTNSDGYWAATTTADRAELVQTRGVSIDAADVLQQRHWNARIKDAGQALHPEGEGGWFFYRRRGCRCPECRSANSARRRAERARRKTTKETR